MRHLTTEEAARVVALVEDSFSQWYVANLMGVHQSTISQVVNRYRASGQYARRASQGRHRITTPADDRFLRFSELRQKSRIPAENIGSPNYIFRAMIQIGPMSYCFYALDRRVPLTR